MGTPQTQDGFDPSSGSAFHDSRAAVLEASSRLLYAQQANRDVGQCLTRTTSPLYSELKWPNSGMACTCILGRYSLWVMK
jgi:hypothetical protein